MTQPPDIGQFVFQRYLQTARKRGQRRFTIAAGDVHTKMGLKDSIPAVCAVLGSRAFAREYSVRLARRDPTEATDTAFTFELGWTEKEVRQFTKRPLLATLATTHPSGAPQAVPVWYDYDGTHFRVTTSSHLPKVRNIRRDPRVALVIIDTSRHNFDKLVVRGRAQVATEGAREVLAQHTLRYLGAEAASKAMESYRPDLDRDRVVINIKPEKYL